MVQLEGLSVSFLLGLCSSVRALPALPAEIAPKPLGFEPSILQEALAHPELFGLPEAIEPEMNLFSLTGNVAQYEPSEVTNATTEALSKREIFGPDNRVYWPSTDYPYRAMGRIEMSNGLWCSASLIGARVVATARHCNLDGQSFRFQPAYDNGERLGQSPVTAFIQYPVGQTGACSNTYDWTLYILRDRLGEANGYLGAKLIDPNTQHNRAMFFQYGYPQDKGGRQPYRQEAITAKRSGGCETGSPIYTDADIVGGQSGSPMWLLEDGSRYQYGIAVGGSASDTVVAGGTAWLNAVGQARRDFP